MNPILKRHFVWHIILSLVIFAGAVAVLTAISVQNVREDASEKCKTVASLTASMIHTNYLQDFKIVASGDPSIPEFKDAYNRIYTFIRTIKTTYKDLTFLYTFKFNNDGTKIIYLVDSEPQESSEFSAFGTTEKTAYPPFKIYYQNHFVPFATKTLMSDPKWGWFISGYAPVMEGQEIIGHVATDISEAVLSDMIFNVLGWCLIVGGGGGFLLMTLGVIVYIRYNTKQNKLIAATLSRQATSARQFVASLDSALTMPVINKEELKRQVEQEMDLEGKDE